MKMINRLQTDILFGLSRYGFLAVSQFHLLTGKSVGYIREMLGSLKRKGFVKSYRVEVAHKVRAENIYYLTEQAKEFLIAHKNAFEADIKLPIGTPLVVRDYFHRYHTISVQIAIYQHFEKQGLLMDSFWTYFDKTGNARSKTLTAKCRIDLEGKAFFIPDCILTTPDNIYLIEMYCDKDSKRILNSLATHAKAISLGTPAKKFDMQVNPHVLAVFEHSGIKDAVIQRLEKITGFQSVQSLYYFASLEDVKADCSSAWKTITKETLVFT